MRKSLVVLLFVAIVLTIVSLVACNTEVPEETGLAQVTFAASVPKSLNQDGKSQTVNAKVTDYKWQYVVSKQPITLSDSADWKNFYEDFESDNPTTGIGSIKNLDKNNDYYFALRAYSTGTDSLLEWEGKTDSSTKLAARNTTVTITVYSVGQGSIYFNFTAPVFADWNSTLDDKFVVSWTAMGDSSTSGTNTYEAVFNDDADEFVVNTVKDNLPILLKAGTYLFTVKQQTYNEDTDEYEDVSGRKQVLIVDAQSGVDTVIAGSLDSTSYQVFNYEAGAAGTDYGIEVVFMDADVAAAKGLYPITINRTGVYNADTEAVIQNYWPTKNGINHVVNINHGEYVRIVFTSATSNLKIYVNGDYVNTTSSNMYLNNEFNNNFYKKAVDDTFEEDSSTTTYLNGFVFSDNYKCINAYGKKGVDYILTFVDGAISNSFTIKGTTDYHDLVSKSIAIHTIGYHDSDFSYGDEGYVWMDLPSTYQEAIDICDFDVKVGRYQDTATAMQAKVLSYDINGVPHAVLTLSRDNYQNKYFFSSNGIFDNCVPVYTDAKDVTYRTYSKTSVGSPNLFQVGFEGNITTSSTNYRTSSTDGEVFEVVAFTSLNETKVLGMRLEGSNKDFNVQHRYAIITNTDASIVQITEKKNNGPTELPWDFELTLLKEGITWLTVQDLYDGQILKVKVIGPVNKVTFDSKGGSDVTKQFVFEGDKAVKPTNPKKTGYVFAGWTADPDAFSTSTNFDFDTVITTDSVLYAKWKATKGKAPVLDSAGRAQNECTWVQLWEDGPKFAEFNVGSTVSAYDSNSTYANVGGLYRLGATVNRDTKPKDNTEAGVDYLSTSTDIQWLGTIGADTLGDTAKLLWGEDWQMIKQSEWYKLNNQYNSNKNLETPVTVWKWCDGKASGDSGYNAQTSLQYAPGCTLAGYKVSGVGDYSDNSIFLPAQGHMDYPSGTLNGALTKEGNFGLYWTSTPKNSLTLRVLIGSTFFDMSSYERYSSFSVRPMLRESN